MICYSRFTLLFLTIIIFFFSTIFSLADNTYPFIPVLKKKNYFIENKGQWSSDIKFMSRLNGANIWITDDGVFLDYFKINKTNNLLNDTISIRSNKDKQYNIQGQVIKMSFVGSNLSHYRIESQENLSDSVKFIGIKETEQYYNYFIGNDEKKWQSNVKLFEEVFIKNLYSGIDIRFYFDTEFDSIPKLRYDFIVQPNKDIDQIKIQFEGQDDIFLSENGDLVLKTFFGNLFNKNLYCYQISSNESKTNEIGKELYDIQKSDFFSQVKCEFIINEDKTLQFFTGSYNNNFQIVIDPLIYSTYIGGSEAEEGFSIAIDSSGSAYVIGRTFSKDFPIKIGVYDSTYNGGNFDVILIKVNSSGSSLEYSTYIGGNGDDEGVSVAIDQLNNVYLTGKTKSSNFPMTQNTLDGSYNGDWDIFITKFNPSSSTILSSTFLGGQNSDEPYFMKLDKYNNIYITGRTTSVDFPIKDAYQKIKSNDYDAFVSKLNSNLKEIIYSTFVGGNGQDEGRSIYVDASFNAYIVGSTTSSNYPIKLPLDNPSLAGDKDIIVTKFNSSGSQILLSTIIGGLREDIGNSIALDDSNNVYIVGKTSSRDDQLFPIKNAPPNFRKLNGPSDAFLMKLDRNNFRVSFSAYLGGNANDEAKSLILDDSNNVYITGYTESDNFSITDSAIQRQIGGGKDIFVTKFNNLLDRLIYSTFFGGSNNDQANFITLDRYNNAFITGITSSSDFPITQQAFDKKYNENEDIFLAKIGLFTHSISTSDILPKYYCQKQPISISFSIYGVFNPGNIFTAQLSDENGSFTSPRILGKVTSTLASTINTTLPSDLKPGKNYRVRVVSSNPPIIGSDNGSNITINPLPNPNIIGRVSVCENDIEIYTTNEKENTEYQWFVWGGSAKSVLKGSSSITVHWNKAGNGKIRLIKTDSQTLCKDSSEINIIINALPQTKINGNENVVQNSEEKYFSNLNNGVKYKWEAENGIILGSDSSQSVLVRWNNIGIGKVILYHTDSLTDCISSDTLDVSISKEIPKLILKLLENKEICFGESKIIGDEKPANGGVPPYKYKWTPSNGLNNDSIPNPIAAPNSTIEYTLTVWDSRDSSASAKVRVTVNPLPITEIYGSKNVTQNSEITYTSNLSSGVYYLWSVDKGIILGSDTSQKVLVRWNKIGTGKVILRHTNKDTGCQSDTTIEVSISAEIPPLVLNIEGSKEICEGDSIEIGNQFPADGGKPPYRYKWSPQMDLNNDTIPNPIAKPKITTQYTLTVTDSRGVFTNGTVKVVVNDLPHTKIIGDKNVRESQEKVYSSDKNTGVFYRWSVENGTALTESSMKEYKVRWDKKGIGKVILLQIDEKTGCQSSDTLIANIEDKYPTDNCLIVADSIFIPETKFGDDFNAIEQGTIIFTNNCPTAITINEIELNQNKGQFKIKKISKKIPCILNFKEELRITVEFIAKQQGEDSCHIGLITNNETIKYGKLKSYAIYDNNAPVTWLKFEAEPVKANIGDTVRVNLNIIRSKNINLSEELRYSAVLSFNGDVLNYEGKDGFPTIFPNKKRNDFNYEIRVTNEKINGGSQLLELKCIALAGEKDSTELFIDEFKWIDKKISIIPINSSFYVNVCEDAEKRLIIRHNTIDLALKFSPLPANNFINIEYDGNQKSTLNIKIFDSYGRLKEDFVIFNLYEGKYVKQINLESYSSGIYNMLVEYNGYLSSKSFVVVK